MKTLVLYYYNENDNTIINLSYFLKHGLIKDPNYYYVFIINNNISTINIKETDNIKVVNMPGDNNPLFAYSHFFLSYSAEHYSDFERFYFINSICTGPFLPTYVSESWIEVLNKQLETNDLIAPIVEFPPDNFGYSLINIESDLNMPFLHCYMFGTNISSIHLLINIFKEYNDSSHDSLINYERLLSSYYLANDKKICSFLIAFKNIDINDKALWSYKLWNKSRNTCYEKTDNYFGLNINPFELIFINNNDTATNLKTQIMSYIAWS